MRSRHNALLLLHITVLIWGLTGILGRLIDQDAEQVVYMRTVIGVLGLLLAGWWMGFPVLPNRRDWHHHVLTGVIIAGHWWTFFHAIKISSVSIAVTCLAASTIFTALLEPIWNKRRVRPYELILGSLVIAALVMIFGLETGQRMGMLVATTSALLSAWFTVVNGQLVKRDHSGRIGLYELFGAAVVVGVWMAVEGTLPPPLWSLAGDQVLWHLVLGLLCTSFAFVAGIAVMRQLSAFTVSLTVNLEPVYSIVLALVIWGDDEKLHLGSYAGFALILACLFTNGWFAKREARRMAGVAPLSH
ncbi:MAG: DMT family transporter [Flavobacteriales bacterium]|nr:DMT family transporter [Flavobacteriales bacterium]